MKCIIQTLIFSFFFIATFAQNQTILVDFGSTSSPSPWNNLSNYNSGSINNLVNTFGVTTDISLSVIDPFAGINSSGTTKPSSQSGFLSTATRDSFFGNTQTFSGKVQPTGGVRFSNLNTCKKYSFTVFASRLTSENRETQYVLIGRTTDTVYLNVANNTDTSVVFSTKPRYDGTIDIIASPGPNNNNSFGFFYLGLIMMQYRSYSQNINELEILAPNGGEFCQIGKTVEISWLSSIQDYHILEYSTDNGTSWSLIDTIGKFQHAYDWTVPEISSTQCLVRISSGKFSDISDNTFEISSSTDSYLIVVLGSSTAAGSGASVIDSSWVSRYRTALSQDDTRFSVTNLAKGGYTTYHILPNGNPLADSIGIGIDTLRNITKALSLAPNGIIINLPSNDASRSISAYDQMENFRIIVDKATQNGVKVWIATTQPRNFSDQQKIQIQMDTRDSILAVYGDYAIDFWTGIADENGHILSYYDSGDGVHLNDQGHNELFKRVLAKNIVDSLYYLSPDILKSTKPDEQFSLIVYPNPFKKSFSLKMDTKGKGYVEISLYDLLGRKLYAAREDFWGGNNQLVEITPDIPEGLKNQLILLNLIVHEQGDMITKSVLLLHKE
jgi:lysophospholipase L1-like esterase